MNTVKIGSIAELSVAEYLINTGYAIIRRNWRCKAAEIDIVAIKDNVIFFVEVKYRSSSNQGDGLDYITPKKIYHMQRAAEIWVNTNSWDGGYCLMAAAVDSKGNINLVMV